MVRLVQFALAALAIAVAWSLLRPSANFIIVAGPGGVTSHEGIATDRERRLLSELQRMRFPEGSVTIRGTVRQNGQILLRFYGPIDATTQQKIRNLLINNC